MKVHFIDCPERRNLEGKRIEVNCGATVTNAAVKFVIDTELLGRPHVSSLYVCSKCLHRSTERGHALRWVYGCCEAKEELSWRKIGRPAE